MTAGEQAPTTAALPHDHSDRSYEWVGAWSERRARLTPDRIALKETAAGEAYTYADLDRRANRTARALRDIGVDEGDRVAVLSRNRVELVDLFFGTAKKKSVLAPLSHRLAERELAAVFETVDPSVVVVETPFESELIDALDRTDADPAVRSLPTGNDHRYRPLAAADFDGSPVDTPKAALSDPHLLLHTGGSTGIPKETIITHGSIYWNSFNTITSWGLRETDVTPMVFPMFHTGGWNVLTVPFFHIGATVLVNPEVNPGRILTDIERESASVLVAVPTVLRMVARHDDWGSTDLSSLRFVKSGGGPCRETIIETWRDRGVDFSQGYGLTECGPNNFAMPDGAEVYDSVGIPAMHVDARIVDDDGDPVAPGEIGELELAGPHAADGYLGDNGTSDTFGRWVSTGDLAVVDERGYLHIEGRKDDAFVSGGENVYPPRIEDAITEHPKVEEAVVFGVPDETWGAVGKAVVAGDESLSLAELDRFLTPRIARFAIPRYLEVVESLPESAVGKIDRAAAEARFGEVPEQ